MNVVDSSAWLEYFANGANASFFAKPIQRLEELVVPSGTIYEVFKQVLQQRDEGDALRAVAVMQQGTVVDLDAHLAISAARLSLDTNSPWPIVSSLPRPGSMGQRCGRRTRTSMVCLACSSALESRDG